MATCEQLIIEEDYIDMDISNSTTFLCYTIPSPPHSREFEFQMTTTTTHHTLERDTTPSPADELFYKGKLLPLHLPPRLQMVQMLLETSNKDLSQPTTTTTTTTTPFESCNISPANSCYVSGELSTEDYYFNNDDDNHEFCSAGIIQHPSKKSWSKRLKQSSFGLKLKASKAYLRSLFISTTVSKAKESESERKAGLVQFKRERYPIDEKQAEDDVGYRRSFSGVIKWHSSTKSSSSASCSSSSSTSSCSSFSSTANGGQVLKRSSSMNSAVESSIQGAIAYCKSSQQPRKNVGDIEL